MTRKISDLQSFTRFAEVNSADAFRLFRSEAFPELLPLEEHRGRAMWRGLMKQPVTQTAMEEFLVGMGEKQPVTITADQTEISLYDVRDSVQETLRLRRDGWGSFVLTASADGDFIELPRRRLTEEDFIGSSCDLEYRLLVGEMGCGVRTGTIMLSVPGQEIRVKITASAGAEGQTDPKTELDRNRLSLMKLRLRYMLEGCRKEEYVSESLQLIEKQYCLSTEDLSYLRLYQAYLEKLQGHTEEAAAILREFHSGSFGEEEQELEMAYLYLCSLLGISELRPEDVALRVRAAFERGESSYLLLKLLYLTNPDIGHYPRRRKKAAEETFEAGVRSPLLYAELIRDLQKQDSLVTSLGPCMVQTLYFAARHGLLTEALSLRAAYLSANEKFYSEPLLGILTAAYEKWPLDGILEAIVRLIMKGQPGDRKYFPWYERAVSRNLKIIRLYEYYVETMPDTKRGVLPAVIRKYFALRSTSVSEESRAAVYAGVIRNRQADPETYGIYRDRMEVFAYESLRKGKLGADYAVLYQAFVSQISDEESGDAMAKAAFTERLFCDDEQVRSVVVVHDGLREEACVPVIRGTACICRYTEDAQILFENVGSGRYFTKAAYNLTPLMDGEYFRQLLREAGCREDGFLLHESRRMETREAETEEEYRVWLAVAERDSFTEETCRNARRKVLRYLETHPQESFFRDKTPEDVLDAYAEADRLSLLRVLQEAGLVREAYGVLLRHGTEGVEPAVLVRLASRMIEEAEGEKDGDLVTFSMNVFRQGKYDERMLTYLSAWYSGQLEEMVHLRSCAAAFYIDTFQLDDRILTASVKAERDIPEGPEILRDYVEHGGRRKVIRSYLELRADGLLGSDELVSEVVASCISDFYDRGEQIDFAMKLALLRYRSRQTSMTAHEEWQTEALLEECGKRNLRFRFMQDLPESFTESYHLKDLTFVEVKADPAAEVLLTYSLSTGLPGGRETPKTEALLPKFRGLFVREFTLFYGESLTYHLTIRDDRGEEVLEEHTIRAEEADVSGMDSYPRINRMLRAARRGAASELQEEMGSYLRARETARRLFTLEETF